MDEKPFMKGDTVRFKSVATHQYPMTVKSAHRGSSKALGDYWIVTVEMKFNGNFLERIDRPTRLTVGL